MASFNNLVWNWCDLRASPVGSGSGMVIIRCVVGGELRGWMIWGYDGTIEAWSVNVRRRVEYLWNGHLLKARVRADGKKYGWLGKQMAGNSG